MITWSRVFPQSIEHRDAGISHIWKPPNMLTGQKSSRGVQHVCVSLCEIQPRTRELKKWQWRRHLLCVVQADMIMTPISGTLVPNPDIKSIVKQQHWQQPANMFGIHKLEPAISIQKLLMHEQHRSPLASLQSSAGLWIKPNQFPMPRLCKHGESKESWCQIKRSSIHVHRWKKSHNYLRSPLDLQCNFVKSGDDFFDVLKLVSSSVRSSQCCWSLNLHHCWFSVHQLLAHWCWGNQMPLKNHYHLQMVPGSLPLSNLHWPKHLNP